VRGTRRTGADARGDVDMACGLRCAFPARLLRDATLAAHGVLPSRYLRLQTPAQTPGWVTMAWLSTLCLRTQRNCVYRRATPKQTWAFQRQGRQASRGWLYFGDADAPSFFFSASLPCLYGLLTLPPAADACAGA